MALESYRAKRDFHTTPEPGGQPAQGHRQPIFVVQEHHASHLHYDFRIEADGVLKSWAVPKGPSLDPGKKRLAVRVEDHPLGYATFEGTIPEGQYGAGEVLIWDHGTYDNLLAERSQPQTVAQGIDAGRLEFVLHGQRLRGAFTLVRMKGRDGKKENWLLIKKKDSFAQSDQSEATGANEVELTHPDRVLYPDAEITKKDVFEYYRRIAPRLLPWLRDRPVTLERLPEGIGGSHFWQKNTPSSYPSWLPRIELKTADGKPVSYALVNDLPALLYLVNQGTLTFHIWFSRVGDLDRPDFVLFDLDVGTASFTDAVEVAQQLRTTLARQGGKAFVKTSGKTGLHVLTPWTDEGGYDRARPWAREVAAEVAGAMPDQATIEIRKVQRGNRVYIDTLQNARGHHAVPPFVLRAVPGAPVSMPLSWREVRPDLNPQDFNLRTVFHRLARRKQDPLAELVRTFAVDRKSL
jgi:bifunctional non-homologous end joining protein LigD